MLDATEPYLDLVRKVPLRPIESDEELQRAIDAIDALLAKPSLTRDEDDYLDVLSDVVYKYEKAAHPLEPVPDSAMLKHLMEARDLSRADLHEQTGVPVSTISSVLNGKCHLGRRDVAALAAFFNVSADAFALPDARETRPKHKSGDHGHEPPKTKKNGRG